MKLLKLSIICVLVLISASCTAQVQPSVAGAGNVATSEDDAQFEVNKSALLTGANEQVRIMAAKILLSSDHPKAREAVQDVLKNTENVESRSAICKVLSQSRTDPEVKIPNVNQFIEPLLNLIKETGHPVVPLAAEALLVYDYDTVGVALEGLARDASLSETIRLNAMNALKLRLDRRGLIAIIGLVDDPDPGISGHAKEILHSISIPVGNSVLDRIRIIDELERKSKDEFLRDWVFRQDNLLQQERAQVDMWKRLYREALDKHYNQADIADREALLIEHLKASQSFRKLWAIDKVYKWRSQANTEWPNSLTPVLTGLISDSDKMVRLNAVTQLFSILKIDSANILIQQLNSEKDPDVRTELFAVLGEACRSALVENGVPDDIKTQTLEWAARFLAEPSADQVVKGADVIGRLLEKNGLAEADIETYLGLLKNRFEQETVGDVVIKRNLLRTMTLLCANASGCKRQARIAYKPLFDRGLTDESALVREEAVLGLISIDPTLALKALRSKLVNDSSEKVRARVIALAKDVGTAEDLEWLIARIEAGNEPETTWQSILTILSRIEVKDFEAMYERFSALKTQGKINRSQWEGLLEVGLSKAVGRNDLLVKLHQVSADHYEGVGALDTAKTHLSNLLPLIPEGQKPSVLGRILAINLKTGKVKESSAVLNQMLKTRDVNQNDTIVQVVNDFLNESIEGLDTKATLKSVLEGVKVAESRPEWDKVKAAWFTVVSKPPVATDTNSPS